MDILLRRLGALSVSLLSAGLLIAAPVSASVAPAEKEALIDAIEVCDEPLIDSQYQNSRYRVTIFRSPHRTIYCGQDLRNGNSILLEGTYEYYEREDEYVFFEARNGSYSYLLIALIPEDGYGEYYEPQVVLEVRNGDNVLYRGSVDTNEYTRYMYDH